MKAHYQGERGIRVIRPLIYTREKETKEFAQTYHLPIINENCPACFEQPKVCVCVCVCVCLCVCVSLSLHSPETKKHTHTFSYSSQIQTHTHTHTHTQERARMKKMLSKEETLMPRMYANLRRGIIPLMDDDIYRVIQVCTHAHRHRHTHTVVD
jgi:hypothetical protein